jgi:hypothetical protein
VGPTVTIYRPLAAIEHTTAPAVVSVVVEGFCPECRRPLNVCPVGVPGDDRDWLCCWDGGREPGPCPTNPHYRVDP